MEMVIVTVVSDGKRENHLFCLFQVLLVNLCEGTFLMSVSVWALTSCWPTTYSIRPVSPVLHLLLQYLSALVGGRTHAKTILKEPMANMQMASL